VEYFFGDYCRFWFAAVLLSDGKKKNKAIPDSPFQNRKKINQPHMVIETTT
jgi:hypothetical protein